MGLLDSWASRLTGPGPQPAPDPGTRPRPLTAAGMRVNLTSPSIIHTRRHEWQTAAWDYRDEVPELRFAGDFVTNALGRIRVFPAENRPRGQEPVPLAHDSIPAEVTAAPGITEHTRQCAAAAIERLDLDRHGSSLLARMGENLEFAGECYLLGEPGDEGEQWTIRSVSEVQITQGGARLVEPGAGMVASRDLRPEQCELLRLWSPHPRYYDWPDAAVSALLGTLEGMVLLGRRGRAHDRSRISSGKALFVPDELSLSRAGTADDVDEDGDPFLAGLTEAMLTPIRDESDPSAVVPLVIRGPGMLGDRPTADVIGTVDLHGEDPKNLDERYENLVQRFARGINLPPEIVKGIGDTNHWNGAMVDATMVKSHIEPRAERMVDALTAAYFRPALKAMGVPLDQRNRVCLWFDSSELVQNPNRDVAAKDAHAAGALSDAALARELGFTVDDMPSDVERLTKLLTGANTDVASIPYIAAMATLEVKDPRVRAALLNAAQQVARGRGDGGGGGRQIIDASPRPGGPPDSPGGARTAPAAPSGGVGATTAAAAPAGFRVDEQACRKLAAIDRALTDRLVAHAEATIGRAVERAANRVRGRAQRDPLLAASFPKGCDPVAVCAAAGRKTAGDLTDDELLDGAVEAFGRRFLREVAHAARQAAAVVASMVGRDAADGVTDGITGRADSAWQWLRGRLERHITRVLYGEAGQDGPDDVDPVPTTLVRGALTLAGGLAETSPGVDDDGHPVVAPGRAPEPQSGPGTGQIITDAIRAGGGEPLAWVWGYYGAARADPFARHQRLDGRRFEGFDDPGLASGADAWLGPFYHPGDHPGCLCSVEMIWATPSTSEVRDELQLDETEAMRRVRELAEDDDAAGRTGTTAQRDRDTAAELAALRRQHIGAREGSTT